MYLQVLILFLIETIAFNSAQIEIPDDNNSNYQDMYVIRAAVYQVGILTNETQGNYSDIGDREELTFYRQNGTELDLDKLPRPLLTNLSGETVVAVAPTSPNSDSLPWVYLQNDSFQGNTGGGERSIRSDEDSYEKNSSNTDFNSIEIDNDSWYQPMKRSVKDENKDGAATDAILKVVQGTAVIPDEAQIKSINLPPLLSFKSNLSEIPVPIPNMSIVHYSKVDASVLPAKP